MLKKLRTTYFVVFSGILLTEIFIALFVRDQFVRPYVGDALVTVLICSFFRMLIPRGAPALPICVFVFAAVVEIGQYFDMVKHLGLDGNLFLSVLLGRTFSVLDLVCYGAGCLLFFLMDRRIQHRLTES